MPTDITQSPSQTLKALRAIRCDNARDLSRELDDILAEIQLIDYELQRRAEVSNATEN